MGLGLGLGRWEERPGAAAVIQAREDTSRSRALAMRSGKREWYWVESTGFYDQENVEEKEREIRDVT